MSSSYLVEQLATAFNEIAELKRGRTTHRAAQVLTSDAATGTFTALLPNGEQLSGVSSPLQFLPAPGEQILLRLDGATPIYEPAGIAEDAITGREIAPGAIDTTQLAFDINQYTGGTRIFYGADTPTTDAAGDLWLKELAPGPPPKYETRRWDGQAWTLLQDQGVTEALAKAVAAETAAESAGLGALAAAEAARAAQDTADGKITSFYQATRPTSGMGDGDFWIRSTDKRVHVYTGGAWVESKDADINTALTSAATAQATADGKVRIFAQPDAPLNMAAGDVGDLWIDTDDSNVSYTWSGTAWVKRRIGNGAIEPQSLVARDVIATGTISAALFEAIIVLATIIILGDPNGNHQRLDSGGSRVFRMGPDGQLVEAGRLGFGPGDYLAGGGTASGGYAWLIPENGVANFQGLNISGDPNIMGRPFTQWVGAASGAGNGQPEIPGAQHYIGWAAGQVNGITTEVGIIEVSVPVDRNRWYWIGFDVGYRRQDANEIVFRIRDGGTSSPTITSPQIMLRTVSDGQGFATNTAFRMGIWYPDVSGNHRLGLTAQTQAGGVTDVLGTPLPAIIVIDMGPRKPIAASVNRMGGGLNPPPPPPAPMQEYYRDIPAGAWASSRWSDGAPHPSASGPVQGYTQYAPQNGNSRGHWSFALPPINGTINRIDFYVYAEHWHFDAGGTAIFNIAIAGNPYVKPMPDWHIGGYPKGGEKTVTLPADWYPFFRNGGANGFARADGITVGALSAGTNPTYYGRFSGTRAALRIWWTE